MDAAARTRWIVEQARAAGFDLCGVAPAAAFEDLAHLPEWLERGYAGQMKYLQDARRQSIEAAMPGARGVIVCALSYNTALPYSTEARGQMEIGGRSCASDIARPEAEWARAPVVGPRGWISRYAWGDDYHDILRQKLDALLAAMRSGFAEPFEARAYVDTGPVIERVAAKYAGLGWLAKNTCLINEQLGSWLFLGVILTTLDLASSLRLSASDGLGPAESPPPDLCGNCRLCMDACPTEAIVEPYVLDARRCISYLTIELRGAIPEEFRAAMGWHVFGCDICQDVCPWNRKAPLSALPGFQPHAQRRENGKTESGEGLHSTQLSNSPDSNPTPGSSNFTPPLEWLASLSEEDFWQLFHGSAVRRTKWRGLVRNACVALGNAQCEPEAVARVIDLLEKLSTGGDANVAEHARWALDRLLNRRSPANPT